MQRITHCPYCSHLRRNMPRVDDHLDELGARSRELEGHLFLFGGRFDMEGWDSGGKGEFGVIGSHIP